MRRIGLFVFICCAALFAADTFTQRQREFWSFQKVKPQTPPAVKNAAWARTRYRSLHRGRNWKRRRSLPGQPRIRSRCCGARRFDLIGLPPTPAEVEAFVADQSPDAFAKVVDRLLASPQYGERWGRHWLDLARYAESEGFKSDEARPNAWRYRDYVIDSLESR